MIFWYHACQDCESNVAFITDTPQVASNIALNYILYVSYTLTLFDYVLDYTCVTKVKCGLEHSRRSYTVINAVFGKVMVYVVIANSVTFMCDDRANSYAMVTDAHCFQSLLYMSSIYLLLYIDVLDEKLLKELLLFFFRSSSDEPEVINFNRNVLPAYYGLLRLCCEYSCRFTRQLANHSNMRWAFEHLTSRVNHYPQVSHHLVHNLLVDWSVAWSVSLVGRLVFQSDGYLVIGG